jgi:hypothetical protein
MQKIRSLQSRKTTYCPRAIAALLFGLSAQIANASTTVCVTNATDLQTALNNATGSTETTFIEMARGTYNVTAQLVFYAMAADQGQLDVTGGYNSDCSAQIKNPALTVLDGGGVTGVLRLYSVGGLSVRYLTVQNGYFSIDVGNDNAGLFVKSEGGSIFVDYNIIRDNVGVNNVGLQAIVDPGSTSALHVDGNLIAGDTAVNKLGAGLIINAGTGNAYITNNTVANNVSQRTDASALGGFEIGAGTGSTTLSNNIFYGNTAVDLFLDASPLLINNDYTSIGNGTPGAGSIGNVGVNPQFASTTDYRLQASSPLLGAGTLTPAGNLPTIDIEGNPRSYNNLVDMGAYERGDEIYGNSFDD